MRWPIPFASTVVFAAAIAVARGADALEECRLLRQPDIQGGRIVFVYAGDLWTVARAGGVASRLTAHEGLETFPKFSPDGRTVAFTAEYDGNVDAFTVPVEGGEPTRATWHPFGDAVAEWYPDGKAILVRSSSHSNIQRYSRFFKVAVPGGFPELLPLPIAGYASFAPDGNRIAYTYPTYDNRTWKRYTGGNAPDIWTYDFAKNVSEKISDWDGSDEWPMWFQNTIYYNSDRDGRRQNIWAYDTQTKTRRQVTTFTDYDVKFPSIGGDALVFENGGALYVMELPSEKTAKIQVLVPDDKPATRAEYRNVANWIEEADLSPSAKRIVLAARGDLFTAPAEKGDVRNLTNTPGVRERGPVWSPDGKWIAYFSDASGEYEVHVLGADGKTPGRQVTKDCNTYRFRLVWSPDSKKLAFNDKRLELWWCDVATGKTTRVDRSQAAEIQEFTWSADSKWFTYTRANDAGLGQVCVYSLASGKVTPVSNGMWEDFSPSFDPKGRYLYFASRRTFDPQFGNFEFDYQFRATDKIYAVTLQDTTKSPVQPQSDEEVAGADAKEGDKADTKDTDAKASKGSKGKKGAKDKQDAKADEAAKDEDKPADVRIDLDGIGSRLVEIPVPPGRYANVSALAGKILYAALDDPDPDADGPPSATIHFYDLEKRKVESVIGGVTPGFAMSKDGSKILYKGGETFGIVDATADHKVGDGKVDTGTLMATVDPRAEWKQMFEEAWRLERDFYYDPKMGGLDWDKVGASYRALLPYVAHRHDLNYILGEMIGELSTSHAYVGGGEYPNVPHVGTGLLGCDWVRDERSGLYRFQRIFRDRDWNGGVRAPLAEPGVNVKDGDYLLSVNGRAVKAPDDVYAAFVGTVDKQTTITVGAAPGDKSPRTYVVQPVANEASLRYTAWVNDNRRKVDDATGGRIAYIHVPNTATAGIQEFSKQYYPQVEKQGIIVDERFNGGGFIPDFFVERLMRRTWVYWSTRDGKDFRTPSSAIDGPKCILVNQYAGSGGDAFPYYFRLAGLGPIIGKRTWGGLVGISHSIPLMDGGSVTMPDFGMWDPATGDWAVENHGVDPDIDVENIPADMVSGHDTQLERAIQYSLEQLEKTPPKRPARPAYKVRVGR